MQLTITTLGDLNMSDQEMQWLKEILQDFLGQGLTPPERNAFAQSIVDKIPAS